MNPDNAFRIALELRLNIQTIWMEMGPGRYGVLYHGMSSEFEVREVCLELLPMAVAVEVLRVTDYRWLQQ